MERCRAVGLAITKGEGDMRKVLLGVVFALVASVGFGSLARAAAPAYVYCWPVDYDPWVYCDEVDW